MPFVDPRDHIQSDQPLTIVSADFWTTVDRSNQSLYLSEVDSFLSQPAIQALFDRLHAVENDGSESLALVPYSPIGYVYAAWNPMFRDLIKIGATKRDNPYARVVELSAAAGVPEPFHLVASIPCKNPFLLERAIHSYFGSVRKYGLKKEFFLLSREDVVEHFHLRSVCHYMMAEDAEFKRKVRAYFGGGNDDDGRKKKGPNAEKKKKTSKEDKKKTQAFGDQKKKKQNAVGGKKKKRASDPDAEYLKKVVFCLRLCRAHLFLLVIILPCDYSLQRHEEECEEFKKSVAHFVKHHIKAAMDEDAFLPISKVMKSFADHGYETRTDDYFAKQLGFQLKLAFPAAVRTRTKNNRGFRGIELF